MHVDAPAASDAVDPQVQHMWILVERTARYGMVSRSIHKLT